MTKFTRSRLTRPHPSENSNSSNLKGEEIRREGTNAFSITLNVRQNSYHAFRFLTSFYFFIHIRESNWYSLYMRENADVPSKCMRGAADTHASAAFAKEGLYAYCQGDTRITFRDRSTVRPTERCPRPSRLSS